MKNSDSFKLMHLKRHSQHLKNLEQRALKWELAHNFWPANDVLRGFQELRFDVISLVDSLGICVGDLLYSRVDNLAEILFLFVSPLHRRKGLATILLNGLIDHLGRSVPICSYIDLEVRNNNQDAIAFYQKHDFVEVRIREKYYRDGTDALVMRKIITS